MLLNTSAHGLITPIQQRYIVNRKWLRASLKTIKPISYFGVIHKQEND
ncbi:hypothetical Protein YC6258_03025 [Gynuella sunshinyii YC6258]|uniref:Uncharacterized protein n=1 Tax=Gynuella sunshinyii YC6258 TaxID=1445510 RepID=A0A0C5VNT2_9GAMM|nr:hypothetical Protein YC6258_03025 [Gynuella sunshinyii YC6258]